MKESSPCPGNAEMPTLHISRPRGLQAETSWKENSELSPASRAFFDQLVRLNLVSAERAADFVKREAGRLGDFPSAVALGEALVKAEYLTQYQLDRVLAGTTHGLVLGNHRVLDRLGAGGMGVVFLAEHIFMKRREAIKVLPFDEDGSPAALERFYTEMHVLAQLHHPNIVAAYDAGSCPPPAPGLPTLVFLAMELVDGCDLDQYVRQHGPAPIPLACRWICQAACGLQKAHDHHLIHRDIKPSNLLLPSQGDGGGQVKLSDFGLVRQLSSRLTDPQALLGTIDFMPPEQSADPTSVGSYADIYGLGASLFWLLTGETPYPTGPSLRASLRILQEGRPRKLRDFRPEAPAELEMLLDRLLAADPARRPALALTVRKNLEPFLD